ncbi:hypothetical protein [Aneurinibacillus tyrosinisolvens]|uniref:hypothetical protein n=1 Tax=Aneurinibacillus tyrosinisolvens TaxID=1443435 RepID=UPI000A6FD407|nr:hypothetical protein [Aneurinibacillus tyrosinisolvens]
MCEWCGNKIPTLDYADERRGGLIVSLCGTCYEESGLQDDLIELDPRQCVVVPEEREKQ